MIITLVIVIKSDITKNNYRNSDQSSKITVTVKRYR